MDINEKRDDIYLQGVPYPDETTWCEDKIHESDTKYLLATPKREAASELFEALRQAEIVIRKDIPVEQPVHIPGIGRIIRAALELAMEGRND